MISGAADVDLVRLRVAITSPFDLRLFITHINTVDCLRGICMNSFSKFNNDPNATRDRQPMRSVDRGVDPAYRADLNESMLKGVWRMLEKSDRPAGMTGEEDAEVSQVPKVEQARSLFKQVYQQADGNREAIVNAFITRVGVKKRSTAVNYYERFMREFGVDDQETIQTRKDAQAAELKDPEAMGMNPTSGGANNAQPADSSNPDSLANQEPAPESDDTDRQGIIRTVDGAHLVYKRTTEDSTFEELWIYNINDQMKDELKIRRAILSGTDIESGKTRSSDGTQQYESWTIGNAQMISITGLPN